LILNTKPVFLPILTGIAAAFLAASSPQPIPKNQDGESNPILIGTLKIPAVFVKGGNFEMGDQFDAGNDDEKPVHTVTLNDFFLSATEVTVAQFKKFCLSTNRKIPEQEPTSADDHPVVFITWYEAKDFCEWVGGSLPTEAQWEYAARSGGMMLRYPSGDEVDHTMANLSGKGKKDKWDKTSPVGKFAPNHLGLYDMAGNVYEWCNDNYKSDYYELSNSIEPQGPATSMFKILRGGSWYHGKEELRCSDRFRFMPVARISFVGFRVVWKVDKAETLKVQTIQ